MSRLTFLTAALVAAISGLPAAEAAVIVNDNFDGYANQPAFEATWVPIGGAPSPSALISTEQSVSPTQSAKVPATGTTTGLHRNRLTFPESGTLAVGDQLVWSFDFYDSITGNPQRNYSNLQDTTGPTGTNQLVSMGLNNNMLSTASGGNFYMARILGFSPVAADPDGGPNEFISGANQYFKLNDFGTSPLRSVGWHNLKVVMTTDNTAQGIDYAFYVDNILSERVSNVGTSASIRSYDNIALGSGVSNGTAAAYFDNMYLEFIPGVPPNVAPVVNPVAPELNPATMQGDIINAVFTATDVTALPITFSNAVLSSFVPLITGATNPAFNGTIDSAGNFTWDTTGFARGVYTINATATDSGTPPLAGTGGSFVVTIEQVPEPTTLVMVGVAIAGLFGVRRRPA
jgi:hypothetical protein